MGGASKFTVEDVDFDFENTAVRMIANRSYPETKIVGTSVGPLQEGREFEVKYWIARELVKAGIARFREDDVSNLVSLNKIHWTETIQTGRRPSTLPDHFYPKLRRYLTKQKDKAATDASSADEYNRARRLAQDIVNCRLNKVVALAASPAQVDDALRSLSKEERILYDGLHATVSGWRSKILKLRPPR